MHPFPAGMRVLVVDDDPLCLMILERMLRQCSYNVTTCGRAATALSLIRENREIFDLVISDVYMPDMDGFKLLELIGLELDLPVIMMSANGETSQVMKGITHGACDYLLKPVRIEELRNIWQHVVRRKTREAGWDAEDSGRGGEGGGEAESATRKRKEKDEDGYDGYDAYDDANALKKARVVWSIELHQHFVNAVNQLGMERIVPKRILEIMNVQGLTRENIASHLQKYRMYLKRLRGVHPRPHPVASFQAVQGAEFGGSMQIQVGGGRPAERQLPAKGAMFVTAGATGGFDSGDGGLSGDVDAATLATFAHVHAMQGTGVSGDLPPIAREVGEVCGADAELGAARGPLQSLGLTSLQGLSSADLNMLMQAQQESLDRQKRRLTQTMGAEGRGGYARGLNLNSMQYGSGLGGSEGGMGSVRMMTPASNEKMGTLIGEGRGGRLGKFVVCQNNGLGAEAMTEGSANLDLVLHRAGGLSAPMGVEGRGGGMKSEREILIQAQTNGSQSALLRGFLQEYRRASRPSFDDRTSYV